MEYKKIIYEKVSSVAVVTLNSPENMNALTEQLMEEVADVQHMINEDTSVRAAVLTGSGKAFMAGADLKFICSLSTEENYRYNDKIIRMNNGFNKLRVPVIAAVNGFAIGGGLELALACTIRVVSSRARMGLPEVSLGILPGSGGTQRLPRLIPMGRAMRLLLTGEIINAQKAYELGIADEVAEPDKLMEICMGIANKIAENAPLSVEYIKDCVINGQNMPFDQAMLYTSSRLRELVNSADGQNGMKSFAENRKPSYIRG